MNDPRDPKDRKRLVNPRKVAATRPEGGRLATRSRPRGDRGVAVSRYTEPMEYNQRINRGNNAADGGMAVEENLSALQKYDNAVGQYESRRKAKAAKAKTVKRLPTVNEVNALWAEIYKEVFDEHPVTGATYADWGKFRKNTQRNPITNLELFFADVCNNWGDLQGGPLKWIDDFPDAPNLSFVCKMIRYIRAALENDKFYTRRQKEKLEGLGKHTIDIQASASDTVDAIRRMGEAMTSLTDRDRSSTLPRISFHRMHSNPLAGDRYVEYELRTLQYLVWMYNGPDAGWVEMIKLDKQEGDAARSGKTNVMNNFLLGRIIDEKLGLNND